MVSHIGRRKHVMEHYQDIFPSDAERLVRQADILRVWERREIADVTRDLDPYTREDLLLDQLSQLPSEVQVHTLVNRLRSSELRDVAEGVINGSITACKSGDYLEVAKAINEWVATAEETVTFRRKRRHILAARSRQRQQRIGTS